MKIGSTNSEFIEIDTIYCLVGHKIKHNIIYNILHSLEDILLLYGRHFTALLFMKF